MSIIIIIIIIIIAKLFCVSTHCCASRNFVLFQEKLFCNGKIWLCIGKYCFASESLFCFRHNIASCFAPALRATVSKMVGFFGWCYTVTGRLATTIFNATQRCDGEPYRTIRCEDGDGREMSLKKWICGFQASSRLFQLAYVNIRWQIHANSTGVEFLNA